MKILILCTGNSCRSQMAEGILRSLDDKLEISSAGTKPEKKVNPNAIRVMKEIGIDISSHYPKNVDQFIDKPFDYVITLCDDANKTCPYFSGKVNQRIHIGYEDPAKAKDSEEEVLAAYRKVRDMIMKDFRKFYQQEIRNIHNC